MWLAAGEVEPDAAHGGSIGTVKLRLLTTSAQVDTFLAGREDVFEGEASDAAKRISRSLGEHARGSSRSLGESLARSISPRRRALGAVGHAEPVEDLPQQEVRAPVSAHAVGREHENVGVTRAVHDGRQGAVDRPVDALQRIADGGQRLGVVSRMRRIMEMPALVTCAVTLCEDLDRGPTRHGRATRA